MSDKPIEIVDREGDTLRLSPRQEHVVIAITYHDTDEFLCVELNETEARAALAALEKMINRVFGPKGE